MARGERLALWTGRLAALAAATYLMCTVERGDAQYVFAGLCLAAVWLTWETGWDERRRRRACRRRAEGEVYCASEAAVVAAAVAYRMGSGQLASPAGLADALIAAHAPVLGLDRSVCLRDVVDELEHAYHAQNPAPDHPADYVTVRFAREWLERKAAKSP